MTHAVREATPVDADDVVRLLDAAMLEIDPERVRRRIAAGDVLVATVTEYGAEDRERAEAADTDRVDDSADTAVKDGTDAPEDRVVGVCVLARVDGADDAGKCSRTLAADDPDPTEIEQIAVHRSRRGRGIGSRLVDAAAERADGPLVAHFHEQVRPFYDALGFEIVEGGESDREIESERSGGETDAERSGGESDAGTDDEGTDRAEDRRNDRLCGVLK
ncbi:GNAT family N-acetyltransferase [Halobellus inordinatus]|uniref:GNAT family N-acetyltransferase n=1 Tax=Halobellus inordinatus TaxID=1126236 RepID=UPI002114F8A7|nr:GNAT family N-acetyltransferase [Halobellus ramosii]